MQGDHGLDTLLAELAQDVAVMPDLARIELTLRRFDAGPLDRKTVRVLAELAQQREILAVSVVVVARDFRGVSVLDPARLLLELPPLAVAVVAFDLVGGAGRSPQEAVWEAPVHGQAAAVAGFATAG